MRIYVAGPITSIEHMMAREDIRASFDRTVQMLREQGHDPVSPWDLPDRETAMKATWNEALRADIAGLVKCDAIYLRKGYLHSKGAMLELHIAQALDMKVMYEELTPWYGKGAEHGSGQQG